MEVIRFKPSAREAYRGGFSFTSLNFSFPNVSRRAKASLHRWSEETSSSYHSLGVWPKADSKSSPEDVESSVFFGPGLGFAFFSSSAAETQSLYSRYRCPNSVRGRRNTA